MPHKLLVKLTDFKSIRVMLNFPDRFWCLHLTESSTFLYQVLGENMGDRGKIEKILSNKVAVCYVILVTI